MFVDRHDAGVRLAERLIGLAGERPVVLGLPRGGVPVAFEVAQALGAPLDVIVVRKLGVPFQSELGFGAIGEGGVRVVNPEVVRMTGVTQEEMATVEEREQAEVRDRARRFRPGRAPLDLAGRTVVIVDDGVATGGTARAACQVARARGAARVVLAVPVGTPDVLARLRRDADEVICVETPSALWAIGVCYSDFTQTTDEEVAELLRRAGGAVKSDQLDVLVDVGPVRLPGQLVVPENAEWVVAFVHGSGSSRHSPRNRYVASVLNQAGLATFLFDLLTADEEDDRGKVFDIGLLAGRLGPVTAWLADEPVVAGLPIGYFGASTGAAAALWAAAEPGNPVAAVVSRGGRPDLAGPRLPEVRAATLLIVGGRDELVLDLNQRAQQRLRCENHLEIVPDATHLFEEPGALEIVAGLARDWFTDHLPAG
ncbi:phosphoribosyltransferase [Herbidospora yilanensis]|uniref:phosphoribosyltransferase n=1 Tax=Herbidospora yilanensis TaxID=354426 RepID=UPI000786449C|nr:phosphoribosyltransferase [Herbidospora yilanensis]